MLIARRRSRSADACGRDRAARSQELRWVHGLPAHYTSSEASTARVGGLASVALSCG